MLNTTSSQVLAGLARRLGSQKRMRMVRTFIDRCEDSHLKDLVVDEMDSRRRMRIGSHTVWNFGCDGYLGLDWHPKVRAAMVQAAEKWGLHNGTSRMFASVALCEQAERRLANWLEVADTLIFPSVTLANIGLIPALALRGDLLIVDRSAHASIHEAVKIALAQGVRHIELHHCRPDALRKVLAGETYRSPVLLLDGVHSMTGETPPLAELLDLMRRYGGVCYIDDAHGTAVVGDKGRGAAHDALGDLRDVLAVGSLSKGFSCLGAFVTCTPELKVLLKMRSMPYIFGGPVPPPYLAAVIAVCDILESGEYEELIERLGGMCRRLRYGLETIGFSVTHSVSPIVSVLIGGIEQVLWAGKWLFDRGYYVQSVTFPAVPFNGGLLRILVNANHPEEAAEGLLGVFHGLKTALAREYR